MRSPSLQVIQNTANRKAFIFWKYDPDEVWQGRTRKSCLFIWTKTSLWFQPLYSVSISDRFCIPNLTIQTARTTTTVMSSCCSDPAWCLFTAPISSPHTTEADGLIIWPTVPTSPSNPKFTFCRLRASVIPSEHINSMLPFDRSLSKKAFMT